MKKRTSVLTRLGIGAVTVATFGLGIPVLSATPAAASTTTQQLNIVPVSAANNTEDNGCQEYRVTSANLQWGEDDNFVYDGQDRYHGHVVNVILNPSAGINSQFCDSGNSGFGLTSDQGVGIPDQFQFHLNSDNDYNQTYFEFGINEHNPPTPVAGTIGVQAYVDQGSQNAQVDSGEPQASATDTILAGVSGLPDTTRSLSPQQDHLVDKVTATPLSQDAASDNGDDFTWYKVTASHGTETMQGVDINYQVKSKQGRVVDIGDGPENNVDNCINGPDFEDNVGENQNPDNAGDLGGTNGNYFNEGNQGPDNQDETDGAGVLYCQVYAPQDQAASGSNPAQSGPYDVNFFVPQPCGGAGVGPVDNSGCHEPQAHVTLNTYNTPTDTSGVRPTCGDQSTARNSEKVCFETPNASGETFTARAVDIDTGGTPEPNTVINWDLEYGGQCNKYTAGGGNDCEFLFDGNIDTPEARSNAKAQSNAKASPSFTEADSYTGVLGQVTKYYEAQDGSIGVATMPDQCVTGGSGTCSVTMKLSKTPQDGATFFPIVAFNDTAAGGDGHTAIDGGPTLPITGPSANGPATPFLGGNDCTTTDNDRLGDYQRFYCGAAAVEFSREFTPGDTNIGVDRSNSSARTGKFVTVTSHIMNQFRNHITYPDPTTFHCLGCVFSDGTKQLTEQSSADGRAQVAVTRTHKGKAKVVAEIGGAGPQSGGLPAARRSSAKPDNPSSPGTLCGQHHGESRDGEGNHYYSPSARQGNCSASTTIHFHGPPVKSVERPHLSAGSLHHHHVKLKAKTKPSLSGVKVKFYKKTHSGLKKLVGAHRTNSKGVAKSKVGAHHHSKFVAKVVGLKKSLFTSKFSNRVTI